jgi:hypothetical protein
MSTSSGFGRSSIVTVRGSSAMPQIGHAPGRSWTISGCMGQVYDTPGNGGSASSPAGSMNSSGSASKRFKHPLPQK